MTSHGRRVVLSYSYYSPAYRYARYPNNCSAEHAQITILILSLENLEIKIKKAKLDHESQ
jgi:hypothetical protein